MLRVGHPHPQRPDVHFVSGHNLADEAEAAPAQETSRARGDEYLGLPVEPVEGMKVEVVVMAVGDEDHARPVDGSGGDRFLPAEVDDPAAEHRVRDDHDTVESDRGTAVPEPRHRPGGRVSRCHGGVASARAVRSGGRARHRR